MAGKTENEILQEQLAYYRARAQEYDESVLQKGRFAGPEDPDVNKEWQHIVAALHKLPRSASVLELAYGTGLWTQELLDMGDSIVALDGAPEMLEVNRAKVGSPRVRYQQADLFQWKAEQTYDLVFFAFWLSHVPPDLLDAHLEQVAKAVKPGGRVFIVDEPAGGKNLSGPEEDKQQTRELHDGQLFRIVKIYYDVNELADKLRALGFSDVQTWVGDYFFYMTSVCSE